MFLSRPIIVQAARDYGALPDAEAVRLARSGEGAGRMPLSADMLEKLLPRDDAPRGTADAQVHASEHQPHSWCLSAHIPSPYTSQPCVQPTPAVYPPHNASAPYHGQCLAAFGNACSLNRCCRCEVESRPTQAEHGGAGASDVKERLRDSMTGLSMGDAGVSRS